MGLKKLSAKMDDYNARLDAGEARKIKPADIEKVLEKLTRKTAELEAELAGATSDHKRARLSKKIDVAHAQIERANWLLREMG